MITISEFRSSSDNYSFCNNRVDSRAIHNGGGGNSEGMRQFSVGALIKSNKVAVSANGRNNYNEVLVAIAQRAFFVRKV